MSAPIRRMEKVMFAQVTCLSTGVGGAPGQDRVPHPPLPSPRQEYPSPSCPPFPQQGHGVPPPFSLPSSQARGSPCPCKTGIPLLSLPYLPFPPSAPPPTAPGRLCLLCSRRMTFLLIMQCLKS